MKYLICEICGGYYHLVDGESLSDFDSCQCGGKLYLLEYGEEGQLESPKIICEGCGNLNNINNPFCSKCGQILISAKEISADPRKYSFKPVGVFASLTFLLFSILVLGLLV
jgi:hypothetical protein